MCIRSPVYGHSSIFKSIITSRVPILQADNRDVDGALLIIPMRCDGRPLPPPRPPALSNHNHTTCRTQSDKLQFFLNIMKIIIIIVIIIADLVLP